MSSRRRRLPFPGNVRLAPPSVLRGSAGISGTSFGRNEPGGASCLSLFVGIDNSGANVSSLDPGRGRIEAHSGEAAMEGRGFRR